MMTSRSTKYIQHIVLRPNPMQFVIDELPLIAVCTAGLVYGGMEDMPLGGMAMTIPCSYSSHWHTVSPVCAGYATGPAGSSSSANTGFSAAGWIIWSCIVSWIFRNIKVSCNNYAV